MSRGTGAEEPRLTAAELDGGVVRLDLMQDGRSVSRLWIHRYTLRVGAAEVPMDGIGGVGTEPEFRNQGYSRRVLDAAMARMQAGSAALGMLYGIRDYYPRWGFATAGPEYYLSLPRVEPGAAALPPGWRARAARPGDLPRLRELYDRGTAGACGAAVRAAEDSAWRRLLKGLATDPHTCRVLEDGEGRVMGYAWRCRDHWAVAQRERGDPCAFILGETMAESPAAAPLLSLCRAWAAEERREGGEPYARVLLGWPPEGPLAAAARRRDTVFEERWTACGGSMARTLDTGRLLRALLPELTLRLRRSGHAFRGFLRLQSETGTALVSLGEEDGAALREDRGEPALEVELPQEALARLALGVFPPEELLDSLPQPPEGEGRELLAALFPRRHPHMHLPDRY